MTRTADHTPSPERLADNAASQYLISHPDPPRSVLLDTNVLLDHLLLREDRTRPVSAMLRECVRHDVTLRCAATSLKDIAYISEMMLRRQFNGGRRHESQSASKTVGESTLQDETKRPLTRRIPWHCIEQTRALCDIVAIDQTICDDAIALRDHHDDFEDDLIIAAARRSDSEAVVTSDEKLIEHFPGYCISPRGMTALLDACGRPQSK